MEKKSTASQKGKTQVLTFRIPVDQATEFERKCLENRLPMSKVVQAAVADYLKN